MRRPLLLLFALTTALAAQDDAPVPSFGRDILPMLQEHCAGCHREGKAKGDVILTSHASILAGIEGTDPIVVPGDVGASLLHEVLLPRDGAPPAMPEDGDPLSDTQVALLARWITAGAPHDFDVEIPVTEAPETYAVAPVLTDVAWAPDPSTPGASLLAVPGRGEVVVHRVVSGTLREIAHRLRCDSARLEALAISPDGTRLAAVGGSPARFGEVLAWDLRSGARVFASRFTDDCLFGVSWSPDGTQIAFGAADTVVRTVDATTGERILFQGAHDDWVLDTCWSTDGSHLVTVGRDRSMKLTKVETQQFIDNITSITPGALKGGLIAVDRRPMRDELLVAGADGAPGVFRMYREQKRVIGDDFNRIHTLEALPGRVFDLEWSANGTAAFAVCSVGGTRAVVRGYAIPAVTENDGKEMRGEPTTLWTRDLPEPAYGLALSPDGARLAVVGRAGSLTLLDAKTGAVLSSTVAVPLQNPADAAGPGDLR